VIFPGPVTVQVTKVLGGLLLNSTGNGKVLDYILTEFHPVIVKAYKDKGLSPTYQTRIKLLFQFLGSVVVKLVSTGVPVDHSSVLYIFVSRPYSMKRYTHFTGKKTLFRVII